MSGAGLRERQPEVYRARLKPVRNSDEHKMFSAVAGYLGQGYEPSHIGEIAARIAQFLIVSSHDWPNDRIRARKKARLLHDRSLGGEYAETLKPPDNDSVEPLAIAERKKASEE